LGERGLGVDGAPAFARRKIRNAGNTSIPCIADAFAPPREDDFFLFEYQKEYGPTLEE